MADDNKEMKKGLPGGFIWIMAGMLLLVWTVNTFIETKFAKVGFSYQLEHLVNLQLIQPEDSRKTAANDNLVTFSGKFRERKTEEGKKRYKYLELVDANHQLTQEKEQIQSELGGLQEKIKDSADWFLHLSGISIPSGGYVVVDNIYNQQGGQDTSVIIRKLSDKKIESLPQLQNDFRQLKAAPTDEGLKNFGRALSEMVRNFRSPMLGIGNEELKQTLRTIDKEVNDAISANIAQTQRLTAYEGAFDQLQGVVNSLNTVEDHARLSQLRTVRNYKQALTESNDLVTQLDENEARLDKARQDVSHVIWFFNNKELSTRALEKQDAEAFHHWFITAREEWNSFSKNRGGIFKAPDQPLNTVLEKTFKSEEPTPNYASYLFTIMPILLVVMVLYFLFSRQMKGAGSNAMNFGKSPAKLLNKEQNKVTFKDVAGAEEAIEELEEIVEFLKNPQKFTALGGHIPKGVLCIGPPGTGKTLIAKAVAGEADRPFFSISGSDFVEMFVGVGASRIRDMFEQAKKNAPCIIFMDEIDAVGRHRGAGIGGGHDEREQTLNQLLVEMDGFDTNDGVILIAATNRPDVLDKALLRPGRFDRRVMVGLPDIKGRFEILKVHAKKIKMDESVDLMTIARSTPGSSGADLANLLNEAALLAARKGRSAVTQQDTNEARDKVLYGKERRSLELDEEEKRTTAYHEAGHAVVGLVVDHGDPVDKVTIIPRGFSLGATMFLPEKNKLSYWKNELIDQLAILMGGRCAEDVFVHDVSSGARQDIEQATNIARSMVCEWGMSDKLGAVAYDEKSEGGQYLGIGGHHEKKYSEETAKEIDAEVRRLLDEANERAHKIIEEKKKEVELMVKALMEFETLDANDVKTIIFHPEKWDFEAKRVRLKEAEELHKHSHATPPPPPEEEEEEEGPSTASLSPTPGRA